MNAWWSEEHKREIRFQFNYTMNGYTKPYFTDDTGRLYRDETGNLDDADTIPMRVRFGASNCGVPQGKGFHSVLVDVEDARGAILQYSIDGGDFITLGQITQDSQTFVFRQNDQLVEGRTIDYQLVHNSRGTPPVFNGQTTYYNLNESVVNEFGQKL